MPITMDTKVPLALAVPLAATLCILPSSADPIAGCDFSDTAIFDSAGGNYDVATTSTEDLDLTDGIMVSDWVFEGGGRFQGLDANAQVDMPSDLVTKIDGNADTQPAVGTLPAAPASVSFSIDIPARVTLNLTSVTWSWRKATPSGNVRWLAFRTSLDANLTFSEEGLARPAVQNASIDLSGPAYQNLTDTTVTFIWYAGGEGSGDIDFDTPVVNGTITAGGDDSDDDGMADSWEQQIIDADPGDAIASLAEVLPADDFDGDGSNNLAEFVRRTDPLDQDSDDDMLSDGVETGDGTFDSLESDTGTDPLDDDTDDDSLIDGVETNDGTFDSAATDTGTNPLVFDTDRDSYGDGDEVTVHSTDPNDAGSSPALSVIAGCDFSDTAVFDAPGGAYDNAVTSSDDLSPDDEVTVSDWVFDGSGFVALDANAQVAMPSDQVTKIDGNGAGQPAVGTLPDGLVSVSFSIDIPAGTTVDLRAVTWNWRKATSSGDVRWLAFRTSLDENLTFSELGLARNAVQHATVDLSVPAYQGLTDTTVTFYWYAGGQGSGDIDFDTVTVHGTSSAGDTGMRIREIVYDDTSEPGNIIVTLTFDSQLDREYSVYTSTDFAVPVRNRIDVNDAIPGGDGSTTFVISFNDSLIPTSEPRRFFVVRENDP